MASLVPIGVLSNLTGVPPETIRTWERRYALLEPSRDSAGRRLYSPADLERILLVADLTRRGEQIRDLALMDTDELRERGTLHQSEGVAPRIRVAFVGASEPTDLSGVVAAVPTRVEVVAWAPTPGMLALDGPVDALVLEWTALGADPGTVLDLLIQQARPTSTLVVASYLSRPMRHVLDTRPIALVQGPLPTADLRGRIAQQVLVDRLDGRRAPAAPPIEMRFERPQLESLMNKRPDLDCECPNHIAQLVLALRDFELYSRSCVDASAADAELHATLAVGTGRARALMEDLLVQVCAYDGIQV